MSKTVNLSEFTNFHFIGIGGISMSALAKFLLANGKMVSGSDSVKSDMTLELEKLGAKIFYKHSASNLKKAQIVVYSSAISKDNPELKKAIKKNLTVIKRSEFLSHVLCKYKYRIAICGSHGKTTATAMVSEVFILAGLDPTVFLGGESVRFSNFKLGKGEFVITEACEYKKNFLDLKVTDTIVLNIDNDHLDSYGDMASMKNAFNEFISNTVAVINNDDKESKVLHTSCIMTFAINSDATYTAKKLVRNKKGYSFTVYKNRKPITRINLSVIGRHNVYNALACFAICDKYRINHNIIKSALENFSGVKRRNEFLGYISGIEVFADYAHHPKEITASLSAFNINDGETLVVFQPHTYSRTQILLQDFVSVFKTVENLVIYKTYSAREKFNSSGDATVLFEELINAGVKNCTYAHTDMQLKNQILEFKGQIKRVLVLGAGDVYERVKNLIDGNR